jgi:glyoxalase superfamily protein
MAVRFQVTFDCADPDAQARFWAAALDYIEQPPPEGFPDWQAFLAQHGMADRIGTANAIVDPDGAGQRLFFPKVPEPKTADGSASTQRSAAWYASAQGTSLPTTRLARPGP